MRRGRKAFVGLAGLVVILAAASAWAVEVGKTAPSWPPLAGTDGKKHSLDEYKDAKAVLVVFLCNHCPVARAYEERIKAIQHDYKAKGVQVVAINVNNLPEDRLEKMIERARAQKFNFPYLYDPSQKIGRAYDAKTTPHVFLLDKERKLAYQGAIDDAMNPEKAKEHYVRDALDALLAGKTPSITSTLPRGCSIKWDQPER